MAATTGVMADFARMPTSRKALVFGALGLFLGLLYWRFVATPLGNDIQAAQGQLAANLGTQRKNAEDIPKYKALRTDMADLQKKIEENQKALPTEAEVPAFFETLERKVRESGVEIQKWTKLPEQPVEQFVKVPVEIQMSGTFMQIKRFFASLVQNDVATTAVPSDGMGEERERIVSIENLVLSKPEVRNREIFLTAKFTAVTFRQEDQVVAAPDAKAKPAKGAAPASGAAAPAAPAPTTGPASPAMPSPTTPAGAKANVDNSLQKSEDRNATGTGSARLGGGL